MANSLQDVQLRNELHNHLRKPFIDGETQYLIDPIWLDRCNRSVGRLGWGIPPGPIDNKNLFENGNSGKIRKGMVVDLHYKLVNQELWDLLVQRFSLKEGQQPVPRKVIKKNSKLKVEVYLHEIRLVDNSNENSIMIWREFSVTDTIGKVEKQMRREFNIDEESETRIFNGLKNLTRMDKTILEERLPTQISISKISPLQNPEPTTSVPPGVPNEHPVTNNVNNYLEQTDQEIAQNCLKTQIDDLEKECVEVDNVKATEKRQLKTRIQENINAIRVNKENQMKELSQQEKNAIEEVRREYRIKKEQIITENKSAEEVERTKYFEEKNCMEETQNAIKLKIRGAIEKLSKTLETFREEEENSSSLQKNLECPVCLEQMKPPVQIFQCSSGHLVCGRCKNEIRTAKCPTCREANIMGRATYAELLARNIFQKN